MKGLIPERTKKNSLLREWSGPLTKDLVLNPGGFGLGKVPGRLQPTNTVNSVCGFCATGCSLKVHLKDGEGVNLSANPSYPVNLGMACPKGWEALRVLDAPDRATVPLLKGESGKLQPVSWDVAASTFAKKFKEIQSKHGADSLAWLGTGQITNEEFGYLGALGKFGMGIRHGDGNTRQCMATAIAAYKQSFGFDAPPYSYQDFEDSDVLIFVGANPCIAHPIMWQRVMRNPHNPEIIVVDPRRTETANAATQHCAIAPKSDLSLFYGIARELIERGHVDRDFVEQHTERFEDFESFVQDYTLEKVSNESGLSRSEIGSLVDSIAAGKRVSIWWTMGVNQSYEGVRLAQSLINICLMTGNIGRPGTGANSITGQCNAMGSRLFSNTSSLVGGHDFLDDDHREKVAGLLKIDVSKIPNENCWAYDQIVQGVENGTIKGLWIIATNSAHSWIGQSRFRDAVKNLEFLVVQDMYHSTETAQLADLVLPAAGWGEKEGTFVNSERRIGRTRKVRKAPGQALSDFNIFRLLANYWGCGEMFKEWETPETVFKLLTKLTKGRPCDISGIDGYDLIDEKCGIQWPYRSEEEDGETHRSLFSDGVFFHGNGRATFLFDHPKPLPEPVCSDYPFVLLTGRGTSAQWHTQTRTSKSDVLRKLYPKEAYVEVNSYDAEVLGVSSGGDVVIRSRRGEVTAKAFVTPTVQVGQLFMPMHYAETNYLTKPDFDPYSRQPSYKHCAVALQLADLSASV
ncbi:nitrate reductase [Pelagicoccus sp. SDUM812002]|uniref:molybdopterin oxidoreductase family protein n=1 Tax=Pelagicoccus sp. SDUM812002 TaxID=3041266 RepID=UPI00280FC9CC|nr:nitrate reductase [Pelagicoccus sp. SDUM812002]MDQ8187155.1 nitrate reductase [Pelagicoccus sp. SDUM812002]